MSEIILFQGDSITDCGRNREDKFNEACKLAPASYWLRDGVHPTPRGHWIIKNEWIKAFRGYK